MEVKGYRFSRQEFAGALADLGVFLPLAIALITLNGVNASSLFLAAGLLYIGAGLYFKIPMPVQPLKATSVIAITMGASQEMISATAISMALIFLIMSIFDINELLNRFFPRAVIRGIQLSLGIILVKKGLELFLEPHFFHGSSPLMFNLAATTLPVGILFGAMAFALILLLRDSQRYPAGLVVLGMGLVTGLLFNQVSWLKNMTIGYQMPDLVLPSWSDFLVALPVLILPQLPLTFANSIMATTDTAEQYYGADAKRVKPRSLLISLGLANLFTGLIGGMPMCHGSGGLTAHYRFGARSGGSSIIIGSIFVLTALLLGKSAVTFFNLVPLAVLGALLIYIGLSHTLLIKDIVANPEEISIALGMGIITFSQGSLALAFVIGLVASLTIKLVRSHLHVSNHS